MLVLVATVFILFQVRSKDKSKPEVITVSTLEKMINVSELSTLNFIFLDQKANASIVPQEAFRACEADVQRESEQQTKIYDLTKQNAVNVLTAYLLSVLR